MTRTAPRISFAGFGNMGRALAKGLLADGIPPGEIIAFDISRQAREAADGFGIASSAGLEGILAAETMILAVKPKDAPALLEEAAGSIGRTSLLLSIVAGLSTSRMEDLLGDDIPVVRAMPNTPALLGEGMTVVSPGRFAGEEETARAERILSAVGEVIRLDEGLMDAVTAVSGSGPAYFFLLIEAIEEAAVSEGIPREIARRLAVRTARGAGILASESEDSPAGLRRRVTSPGGTTEAAVRVLEEEGLMEAIGRAVRAAAERSRELG